MLKKTLLCLAAALAAAGCADVPQSNADSRDRGEIVTGSNIPRKNPPSSRVETVSGEEVRRNRDLPMPDNPAGDGGAKSR